MDLHLSVFIILCCYLKSVTTLNSTLSATYVLTPGSAGKLTANIVNVGELTTSEISVLTISGVEILTFHGIRLLTLSGMYVYNFIKSATTLNGTW